ncbi:sugar ABC transporter ATP-binding protein [Sutcliffiella rhizosphaerae]|uniref:Ribose import ATP-binding protein RbsA n=1 Tax=Sutcliffiella rhizosphaerae TaxID=2880967 RepID=A0ABN8AIZ1_9BACI|nr:sugar ABC transporter ATP-binding protein [Sutcliffiella rhizosphaerae]CAG9623163.1 Ribose import ATP-binding protein RbsA [Sutcliffiella rhizosphaerae]
MTGSILQMRNISMDFPGVKALSNVDFTATSGSIHALVGANGAGKSTLMKVLAGANDHYQGQMLLEGKSVSIQSPADSQALGIQIVYQEVDSALIPPLTVVENIMLQETVQKSSNKLWINWKEVHRQAAKHLQKLNISISTKRKVNSLTLAEKQMVLLARAMSTKCKFLILDEPTAPLSNRETDELFTIMRALKNDGVGIIFISHRIPEILEICDEITVLRNGKVVKESNMGNLQAEEIVESMLGQKLETQFPPLNHHLDEIVLSVDSISDHFIQDVSLEVKAGEVVGIAGLVGAGKTELCKALFGCSHITKGDIAINGAHVRISSPYRAVKLGLALVPEERRKEGINLYESASVNLTASSLHSLTNIFHFIDRKAERRKAEEMIQQLGIKITTSNTSVHTLSGGNQQKIAIGKWLVAEADIYIFDEPTKGVDVGAKKDIFQLITALANRGKAIIYASAELSEIVGLTNKVYVMYDGTIVKELETAKTTEEEILFYSTGGTNNESRDSSSKQSKTSLSL